MEEKPFARKLCNALIPEAEHNFLRGTTEYFGVEVAREFYGGLWVGGTVFLTSRHLKFQPNALNRKLHKGDYSMSIPLNEVTDLAYEFGFFSGIIRVTTRHGAMKFRCFGAKRFLSTIARGCPNVVLRS